MPLSRGTVDMLWRHARHRLLLRVAFWPVACSLAIMTLGGAFLWDRTGSLVIEDRERVFGALADLAQHDLESRLEGVVQDLQLWSTQWFQLEHRRLADEDHQRTLDWAFSFRSDQRALYELVLFVDRDKRVRFAKSPSLTKPQVESLTRDPVETFLGVPATWLEPLMSQGMALAQPPRALGRINALRQRPPEPLARDDVPLHYQLVVAMPARDPSGAPSDVDGAVIAVASWQVFQQALDRVKTYSSQIGLESGYAFLVDTQTDLVIGHELRDPKADNLYAKHLIHYFGLSSLAAALRNGTRTPFRYDFRGPKFAALRRITPPSVLKNQLAWGLGLGVREDEIRRSVGQITSLYLLVGILATLVVLAATLLVGRHLSMSLKELIRVARDAGVGGGEAQDGEGEIAELQQLVNELAVRQRESRTFKRLVNPYVVGNPIHDSSMFFGRQEDIGWIKGHLQQPGNELILLTGQRRIGKTSLLHHVKRHKAELGLIPFFLDTQSLIPSAMDDVSFYRSLLEELRAQFCEAVPDLPEPQLSETAAPQESIWKLIKYLNNARKDAVPVLLIDELENFEHKFKSKTLTPDILKFLAGLLDGTRTVSFIATGSDRLEKRKARYWSALLVKSVRRHLGVLSSQDALRMVTEPLAGRVTYADNVPTAILRLSGCHPFYTQDICQRLVNEINTRQTYVIDRAVLEEVLAQTLHNPPPTLDYFWTKGVRIQGRVFLSLLGSLLSNEHERVGVQDVIDQSSPALRQQLVASQSHLASTVDELTTGDWLDNDHGKLRFKPDLLRLWLQREHPPSSVEIEILYPAVWGMDNGT